ncbi:ABC transporter ATP-binding protein [Priestia flexa]|uniref:ABC transporter ATP-binding protein n=1 Tax=Priestia flexa TaxID=86664 RepID=UPI001B3370A6|nr:ABC transporter ATP-binding protein [Priestia flexa]
MTNVIEMNQIYKSFGEVEAVKDLSFTIQQGEVVALLGPNGAGKSTTLSMIYGTLLPTSGSIFLLGQEPTKRNIKNYIGVMTQEVQLIEDLTVKELLNLFRAYYSNPLGLNDLMKAAQLEHVIDRRISQLSGGQKKRVSFALAIVGDPKVIFLDEPTVAMDIESRENFWLELRKMASFGKTIVFSTHYLEEADEFADRMIIINQGSKIADGSISELKRLFADKVVSFETDYKIREEMLSSLPYITKVEMDNRRISLYSNKMDELLVYLYRENWVMKDITVSAAGLNEIFLTLTRGGTKNNENVSSSSEG